MPSGRPLVVALLLWFVGTDAVAQRVSDGPAGAPGRSAAGALLHAGRFTTEPPTIDGSIDDSVWTSARAVAPFVQFRPEAGAPSALATGVQVLFDDDAMYVAMELRDDAVDSIVGQLTRRDQYSQNSDWAHVYVDAYHDRRTAYRFSVNPRGVKVDGLHFGDTQEDASWDAVWEAAARIGSTGWTAEFRIPLSQLRFANTADQPNPVWGVNFGRDIARYGERSYWAPISPDASGFVSQFGRLAGVGGLSASRGVEVSPYTVMRVSRAPALAGHPLRAPTEAGTTIGADVRYRLASDFNLSLAVNPDFGQVEADPSEVNLSAFESFLQERRPFFVEGTDLFRLTFPEWPPLFYSRRIGRAPVGQLPEGATAADLPAATTILAAAKLSGRTRSGWSLGLLDAVTSVERAQIVLNGETERSTVEPAANYAVGRVAKDFRDGESGVGLLATAANRPLADGTGGAHLSAAYVVAADGRHRFADGRLRLRGSVATSHVRGSAAAVATAQRQAGRYYHRPDAGHLTFDSTRTTLTGVQAGLEFAKVGGGPWRWAVSGTLVTPGYEINDLGFNNSADRVGAFARIAYERYRPSGPFRRWTAGLAHGSDWTLGGERRYAWAQLFGNAEFANRWSMWLGVGRDASGLAVDALRGGPALWRPGYAEGFWGLETDPRHPVRLSANGWVRLDDAGTGHVVSVAPGVTIRPSPRTELSLHPGMTRVENADQYVSTVVGADGPTYLFGRLRQTTASVTARVNYTFRPGMSLQVYAQPFYSAGAYDRFRSAGDLQARSLDDRLPRLSPIRLDAENDRYVAAGVGPEGIVFGVPDFNVAQFRSNAVFRWEYRPGSTLFLVWGQDRSHDTSSGRFRPWETMRSLFGTPGTDVFLVKLSYWLSR